jgi:hypothetical protein
MSAARLPSGEWLAVGAFGRVLRSVDDGKSWQPHAIPGLSDWHLNSISGSADGKQWLITGEAGTVLRSDDGGASWSVVPPFYKGSIYGAVQLASGTWVAYGMRGNVHFSQDGGRSWQAASVQAPVSTYGHAVTDDGRLLAGQGGIILASQDQGTASRSSARKAAPASPASTGRPTAACCSPATAACSATSRPPAAPTRPRAAAPRTPPPEPPDDPSRHDPHRRAGGLPGPHADRLAPPSAPSSCCSPWAWAIRPSTPGSTPASTS